MWLLVLLAVWLGCAVFMFVLFVRAELADDRGNSSRVSKAETAPPRATDSMVRQPVPSGG